jgi:hypothetical protein
LIPHEKGGGCSLGKIAGLFTVKTFEATDQEVIGADDLGLVGVVGVARDGGVDLVEVVGLGNFHLYLC